MVTEVLKSSEADSLNDSAGSGGMPGAAGEPDCDGQGNGHKQTPSYTVAASQLYRRTVLDLLYTFGRKSASTHIFCDIDMTAVEAARRKLQEAGTKVTVTVFLLKAIALAQLQYPESRTLALPLGWQVTCNNVVAGFTVERLMPGGPAVFFGEIAEPHLKSLAELSHALKDYASGDFSELPRLREQKQFAELPFAARAVIWKLASWFPAVRLRCQQATFGFSSLGALGADVVFGPSVCTSVFGVGAVRDQAVVRDKQIVVRPILSLTLSYDQRTMDGGVAARFLREVKELIEGCDRL